MYKQNKPISYFIPIKGKLFLIISKNGCSTLKYIASLDEPNIPKTSVINYNLNTHDNLHINVDNYFTYEKFNYDKIINNDADKIVIYRDPLERFLSIYNNKNIHKRRYFYNINNIDEFINFAERIINNFLQGKSWGTTLDNFDEHFIPQYYWYNLEDINIVVNIKDLNSFLYQQCGIIHYHKLNVSSKKVTIDDLSEEQIIKIKQLYKVDYELYEQIKLSGKLWD